MIQGALNLPPLSAAPAPLSLPPLGSGCNRCTLWQLLSWELAFGRRGERNSTCTTGEVSFSPPRDLLHVARPGGSGRAGGCHLFVLSPSLVFSCTLVYGCGWLAAELTGRKRLRERRARHNHDERLQAAVGNGAGRHGPEWAATLAGARRAGGIVDGLPGAARSGIKAA